MKYLITAILATLTTGCSNKIEVPQSIEVVGEPTVRVKYELEIGLELRGIFEDECKLELGLEYTEDDLDACVRKKTAEYLRLLMSNNQTSGDK